MSYKSMLFVWPAALLCFAAEERQANVPMSRPELVLATHEQRYAGASVSFVRLKDGRILMSATDVFRVSTDKGMSWSEEFRGLDEKGQPVTNIFGLVNLSGDAIGLLEAANQIQDSTHHVDYRMQIRDYRMQFRRSLDGGKTWSAGVVVNPRDPTAIVYQDMLLRTSSGRIILPAYVTVGPNRSQYPGYPYTGGFVNGSFVRIAAHFLDPRFCSSLVYYSDDDGRTWRRNRSGELTIFLIATGSIEPTFEPTVTEVTPGRLLMILRTRLGRLYQSWSHDNGENWEEPQPTQLASSPTPAQIRTFPKTGHLLCVFSQQSAEEIRKGCIRTRLSAAISRSGGAVWEHFQNVESIHPETRVEPGPIGYVRPPVWPIAGGAALENNPAAVVDLPVGHGDWSYPSVLILDDRVLISHPFLTHDETGVVRDPKHSRLKVLPVSWFYGGREPYENPYIKALPQKPVPVRGGPAIQ